MSAILSRTFLAATVSSEHWTQVRSACPPTPKFIGFPGPSRQCSGVLPSVGRQQLEPGRRAGQSSSCRQRVPEHRLRQRRQVREPALLHQDNARVHPHDGACLSRLILTPLQSPDLLSDVELALVFRGFRPSIGFD